MKTIIEPFRIKSVEPIRMTTVAEREALLAEVGYNLFRVPAEAIVVDLLTDSGTGAMSSEQWAALMRGDESYAGSVSYFRLAAVVKEVFGFDEFLPVHQGRAAEHLLFGIIGGPDKVILGNTHFDTTRANIEASQAEARDIPIAAALDPGSRDPFKGNIDLSALERDLKELTSERVPAVIMTITNNAVGGQPVSLDNLKGARDLCDRAGVPLYLDAARFAENSFLAQERDPQLADKSVEEIVHLYFDLCDGFLLSAKKDAICNNGGLLGLRDPDLLAKARSGLIVTEGYVTYGGLAGRDLDAMAQGLRESTDADYLGYREAITSYMAHRLEELDFPYVHPPGCTRSTWTPALFFPTSPTPSFRVRPWRWSSTGWPGSAPARSAP